MNEVSVVLISRNQAWNTARLVESVLAGTRGIASREVVLVDSASSDGTLAVAGKYPIDVISLSPDQRLTAALGRYVGFQQTTGRYVLFLDGDMALIDGWLDKALALLASQPDVAVVSGVRLDRPLDASPDQGAKPELSGDAWDAIPIGVAHGGGAAIYRRAVLEQVGGFNPELYSDEEPELCIRIRAAGYRVVQLRYPLVFHYSNPIEKISTLVGRRNRNLYLGFGQNLRHYLGTRLRWVYIRERAFGVLPGLVILATLTVLLIALWTGQWAVLGVWALLLAGVILADAVRRRSVYKALYALFLRGLMLDGTLRGFLIPPVDLAQFEAKFELLRKEAIHD